MNSELILTLISVVSLCAFAALAEADAVPRISKEELKPMLASPWLVIVDLRQPRDWESSDSRSRGAIREDPKKVHEWAAKYSPQKTLVLYCA